MATLTFGASAGNWTDGTKWGGGVAPTAADDVLFTGTSAACTILAATTALCRSADFTDALLQSVRQNLSDDTEVGDDDIGAVLSGDLKCPDPALLASFATAVSIDLDILFDAATRGGCTYAGSSSAPGTAPGY